MKTDVAPIRLGSKIGLGIGGAVVAILAVTGSWAGALIAFLALLGTPLFAIMGSASELSWLAHPDSSYRHLRLIAPTVIDQHFSDSPILVTIPLFTFVGYVLAEAKTPDRLVHAARALLGWLPGGLAIVCVVASAIFTVLTGGSGVTIIAIGGLLYPALRRQNYSDKFSLGLVTTGGSVGLLLPYSLPLLVYSFVAVVEFEKVLKAVVPPGLMVIGLLAAYCLYVGVKEKVRRDPPRIGEIGTALWNLKWELLIPVLLIVGLKSNLTAIDESAGLIAAYVIGIEFFVYKDLSWKKDLLRIAKASMSLAGAIIVILAMANSLMNYVVGQKIPAQVLDFMLRMGIEHKWQFLIVMNLFLLVLGMLMEGFSAILVAVPLILPVVADLGMRHPDEKMSPFQLAMIFLLNLELAYCVPPLGLNLFIASFRFNRPVTSLYRLVLPFAGILTVALIIVSYVPWISDVAVYGDIAEYKSKALAAEEKAKKEGSPPTESLEFMRQAWKLECVQGDPLNVQPCTLADRTKFPGGQIAAVETKAEPSGTPSTPVATDGECNPELEDCDEKTKRDAGASALSAGDASKTDSAAKAECNPELEDCPETP